MIKKMKARIVSSERLNNTIWKYIVKPEHYRSYISGQYLQLHLDANQHYYSIANAPTAEEYYELHIRQRFAAQTPLFPEEVWISLPYGICDIQHLHPQKPIIFIAVGTGFTSIRAMIEQLLKQNDPRKFELYWEVTAAEDLYDVSSLQAWQKMQPNLSYFPHIGAATETQSLAAVLDRHPNDLQNWQIVMAGRFDLMYRLRNILLDQGLSPHSILSDAFEFE